MNGKQYWKDKIPIFIINIVCMVLLSVFLFFVGNNVDSIAVILIIWTMLLAGVLTFTYHQRKRRLNRLVKMAEGLEEKYLLSEMLPEPEHAEEQVYFQLLKMASKSMLEQIGTVARNILIDLAKEYSSNEKSAEVTDKQYGAGCAEYIANAIKLYYGL